MGITIDQPVGARNLFNFHKRAEAGGRTGSSTESCHGNGGKGIPGLSLCALPKELFRCPHSFAIITCQGAPAVGQRGRAVAEHLGVGIVVERLKELPIPMRSGMPSWEWVTQRRTSELL